MRHCFAAVSWTQALEPGENRDAACIRLAGDGAAPLAHLAVADGASSTLFSGPWAQLLVEAAAADRWPMLGPEELRDRLDAMRTTFDPLTGVEVTDPAVQNKWQEYGSQSTLVAVTVTGGPGGQLRVSALAVGDSVLLVLGEERATTFPPIAAADFSRAPRLITSRVGESIDVVRWDGPVRQKDLLVLASDGAARVLTTVIERDGTQECWRRLTRLVDRGPGADLAAALLDGDGPGSLQDDATLVLCALVAHVPGRADLEMLARFLHREGSAPPQPRVSLLNWLVSGRRPPR